MEQPDRPTPAIPVVLPYATPAELDRRGVFREGNFLVKPPGALLPDRCVLCNAAASYWLRATFTHAPPLRLVMTRTMTHVALPLCADHFGESQSLLRRGGRFVGAGIAGVVAAIALLVAGIVTTAGPTLSILAVSAVLIWIGDRTRQASVPLKLVRVSKSHLYLSRAGEAYLASLGTSP